MTLELRASLDLAHTMAMSAVHRKESRGAHQRLDEFNRRDDDNYLKHTLVWFNGDDEPRLDYEKVNITRSQPKERVYKRQPVRNRKRRRNNREQRHICIWYTRQYRKPAARPDSGKTITLEILRYIPGQHDKPEFQPFQIPYVEDWSMLDALVYQR